MSIKKSKIPLSLRFVAWAFPKVEKLAPWIAERWFVRIFFSTAKYQFPKAEIEMANKANKYNIEFEGKKVQVYEWGEGKPILLVHGWMGRATQFRLFVPAFVNAGFKVVAFDATGHGNSEGGKSHLMEFKGIIQSLQNNYRNFEMIVGHSLGGVASLHAVIESSVNKLVMISSPTIGSFIMEEFRKKIGASANMLNYFERYIIETYGLPFEHYSASYNISRLKNVDLLLIQDENDREVSMENATIITRKYPEASLVTTKGLGHTRILRDKFVIDTVLKHSRKIRSEQILVSLQQ